MQKRTRKQIVKNAYEAVANRVDGVVNQIRALSEKGLERTEIVELGFNPHTVNRQVYELRKENVAPEKRAASNSRITDVDNLRKIIREELNQALHPAGNNTRKSSTRNH